MSKESSSSTRKALERFFEKAARKASPPKPRRKNEKPEKQVEKECLVYMRAMGWQVEIYEAKATYNPQAGRYVSQAMKAGTCDCMGIMPSGTSVAIEFKAPGRLTTFNKNQRQREFLENRIKLNGFACVVDSAERLRRIYLEWEHLKISGTVKAQGYLLEQLPPLKNNDDTWDLE